VTSGRGPRICLIVIFLVLIAVVGSSQVVLELREGEPPQVLDVFRQPPTPANLRRFERSIENGCSVARVVRPWVQFARFALFEDAGDKALIGRDGWLFYRPAVQYLVESAPPSEDVLAAILRFRDDLLQRGIKLLVVLAPNKVSVYPERLAARAEGTVEPVNPATRDVLAKLKDAGVEVVDLFEIYARARSVPVRAYQETPHGVATGYYLAQDSHWSPEGMRLAAETVACRLLDAGWVTKGSITYEMRPAAVQRHGDVLRMMRVPQIERLFTPEDIHAVQVVDGDTGEPYQDDPGSPVLVLGDSFLRIFERDEPGSGGFIAHLAAHLGFGLTSLVNDGGASTLVRQQLARKPEVLNGKKVVVWEFVERDIRFGTEGWQVIPQP